MSKFKLFHLYWKEYKWDNSIYNNFTTDRDFGIYQVYGQHPIYGDNVLLYIGKVKDEHFSARLYGHRDFDASQIPKFTKIHLGYFCKADDISEKNWKDAIDIVEKVLIRSHFLAYNSKDVKGFLESNTPNILIYNWGNRGSLLPEVSTLRYTDHYHNYGTYNFESLILPLQEKV
jgi:hypothetical protein